MAYTKKRKSSRSRYSKKTKRSAKLAPSTAVAVKKIVMHQMKKVVESKYLDNSLEPFPIQALYHNVPYILETDCLYCTQGITDSEAVVSNRIGDSIYVKNIQMSLLCTAFSTRPNCFFRITVLKVKDGNVGAFLPNPYGHPLCGNLMVAPIDTELNAIVSVVYDRVFQPSQEASNGNSYDKKFLWKYSVPVNRKVRYDNSGAQTINNTYRVYVTAYDTQASIITDNVARFTWFRRTHFLDA